MVDTISYVVPAHNVTNTLAATVGTITARLDADFPGSEVLIVENGSTDGTAKLADELERQSDNAGPTTVRHLTSQTGLGHAMRVGVANSSGDLVVMAGGLAFGFTDLDAALALEPRPAFVIGSKAHRDSQLARPLMRRVSTAGFRVLRRLLFDTTIGDSQGSFVVDGDLARKLFPLTTESGYAAQAEVVLLAELMGASIAEVPVVLLPDDGGSSVRPIRTPVEMLTALLGLRRRQGEMRKRLSDAGLITH